MKLAVQAYRCITAPSASSSRQSEAVAKHFSSITPLGRPGYMKDIEGPAAYLASDASWFQTGDIMVIDGGRNVNSR